MPVYAFPREENKDYKFACDTCKKVPNSESIRCSVLRKLLKQTYISVSIISPHRFSIRVIVKYKLFDKHFKAAVHEQ